MWSALDQRQAQAFAHHFVALVVHFVREGGDTLRASTVIAELKDSKSRPQAGIVTFAHEMHNQRDEVVCKCLRLALVKRKPV